MYIAVTTIKTIMGPFKKYVCSEGYQQKRTRLYDGGDVVKVEIYERFQIFQYN